MTKKGPKKSFVKFLEPIDISQVVKNELTAADFEGSFGHFALSAQNDSLFLNRFTPEEMYQMMEEVGIMAVLSKQGFSDFIIRTERDESLIYYAKLYYNQEPNPKNLLIDLRLSESRFIPKKPFFIHDNEELGALDIIVIEWLSVQNPKGVFLKNKPQLPGQKLPGLGCLKNLMEMMYVVANLVIKDGFLDVPDYLHGAIMYSNRFKFLDPVQEGLITAIKRDLKEYSLSDIGWGMITDSIINKKTNEIYKYEPSEQLFPVSHKLQHYFQSKRYNEIVKDISSHNSYMLLDKQMQEKREQIFEEQLAEKAEKESL